MAQRGLLCVSVNEKSKEAALEVLAGQEMAEIRIDLMYPAVSKEELRSLFAVGIPLIVTCRDVEGEGGWGPLRRELLQLGMEGGATHVDIEMEAPQEWRDSMVALARANGAPFGSTIV